MADAPFLIADLPAGLYEPGVYVTVRTDGDVGLSAPNNRCLLLGYMSTGGTGVPDAPYRALSQSDVDANFRVPQSRTCTPPRSRRFPSAPEVYCVGLLEPSSGTAQV